MPKTENSNVYGITYNNEPYTQVIAVYRASESGNLDPNQLKYIQPIYNELIQQINITSDIQYPILVGDLTVEDSSSEFIHKIIVDGYSFLAIRIEKSTKSSPNRKALDELFIITDIELLNKTKKQYRIHFISKDWYNFNNYLLYSSRAEKPFTTIMKELLIQGGLKVDTNLVDCSAEGFFLTQTSYSLEDSMTYILKRCFSVETGFYFVSYDLKTKKYKIHNPKNALKNIASSPTLNEDMFLSMSDEKSIGDWSKGLAKVSVKNYQALEITLESTKEVMFYNHDYDKNEWGTSELKRNTMNALFPKHDKKENKVMFRNYPKFSTIAESRNTVETLSLRYPSADALRQTFLLNNSLQGETFGVLDRSAGDFVGIMMDKTSKIYPKYGGFWFVTRVFHQFEGREYKNTIQACRSEVNSDIEKT